MVKTRSGKVLKEKNSYEDDAKRRRISTHSGAKDPSWVPRPGSLVSDEERARRNVEKREQTAARKKRRLEAKEERKREVEASKRRRVEERHQRRAATVESYMEDDDDSKWASMSAAELRGVCDENALVARGSKSVLLARLRRCKAGDAEKGDIRTHFRPFVRKAQVDEALRKAGVERIDDVSNCLKQGIYKGHIPFKGEEKPLDTVVISRKCDYCRDLVTLCVRDLLYQDDYGGIGYDDGWPDRKPHCGGEECMYNFVTDMCSGRPRFDDGKAFGHCGGCPGFGECLGDYRSTHYCRECGEHQRSELQLNMERVCKKCDPEPTPEELFFNILGF